MGLHYKLLTDTPRLRQPRWRLARRLLALSALVLLGWLPLVGTAGASSPNSTGNLGKVIIRTSGTTKGLRGVACPTSNACLAVGGSGTILASGDGGHTWQTRKPVTSAPLVGIACPTSATCFAVGNASGGAGAPSTVLATSDSGRTWHKVSTITGFILQGIACPTSSVCLAAAYYNGKWGGPILRSTDGGRTWRSTATNGGGFHAVTCMSNSACLAVGGGPTILASSDGGRTWRASLTDQPYGNGGFPFHSSTLYGITCTSNTCVAVGDGGAIFASGDGGATWANTVVYASGGGLLLNAVACPSARRCLAVAGYVLQSNDSGRTWPLIARFPGTPLFGITCASSSDCIAVGGGGTIVQVQL